MSHMTFDLKKSCHTSCKTHPTGVTRMNASRHASNMWMSHVFLWHILYSPTHNEKDVTLTSCHHAMSHVPYESCPYESCPLWVMSLMSHVPYESCPLRVMSLMSHVPHESCPSCCEYITHSNKSHGVMMHIPITMCAMTFAWAISHMCVNESCPAYPYFLSCHWAYINEYVQHGACTSHATHVTHQSVKSFSHVASSTIYQWICGTWRLHGPCHTCQRGMSHISICHVA